MKNNTDEITSAMEKICRLIKDSYNELDGMVKGEEREKRIKAKLMSATEGVDELAKLIFEAESEENNKAETNGDLANLLKGEE